MEGAGFFSRSFHHRETVVEGTGRSLPANPALGKRTAPEEVS